MPATAGLRFLKVPLVRNELSDVLSIYPSSVSSIVSGSVSSFYQYRKVYIVPQSRDPFMPVKLTQEHTLNFGLSGSASETSSHEIDTILLNWISDKSWNTVDIKHKSIIIIASD